MASLGGVALAAPAQAATGYDLVVVDVRPVTAGTQATGSAVRFQATIKNTGTQATPAGVVHGVAFTVDGVTVTWNDRSTAALAPGATRTLTASGGVSARTWTATEGSHTLGAIVDDVNRLGAETNERNNSRTAALSVRAVQPVTAVTASPATTQAEFAADHTQDVSVSWKIPAGQPVGVTYTVTEELTGYDTCGEGDVVAGTTTGSSVLTVLENRPACSFHGNLADVQYVVTARAGSSTATSAASNQCHGLEYINTRAGGVTRYSFGCDGFATFEDVVERA